MKTTIILIASAFALNLSAQNIKEAEVPAAVKAEFAKQYSSVQNAEWEKVGNNYEAEFKLSRVNMDVKNAKRETIEVSALFDLSGKFIQSETEINVAELPKTVNEYVKTTLSDKKIKEAAKITNAAGEVSYEVEMDKTNYLFDSNGTFIKKVADTDNDMDGKND